MNYKYEEEKVEKKVEKKQLDINSHQQSNFVINKHI